ncbi:MAG TPA: hypothetical protein VMI54_04495 [Polyangiaceae bacterium]|nr:hypothetical protein [Polyangiaceae bacterium]
MQRLVLLTSMLALAAGACGASSKTTRGMGGGSQGGAGNASAGSGGDASLGAGGARAGSGGAAGAPGVGAAGSGATATGTGGNGAGGTTADAGGATAGSGLTGAAGVDASAGAAGASGDGGGSVAPGTCGVYRRIPLSELPATASGSIARLGDGFAVGPWKETADSGTYSVRLSWLRVDAAETQTLWATDYGVPARADAALNMDRPDGITLVLDGDYDVSGSGFWTALIGDGGTTASAVSKLFDGQYSTLFSFVGGGVSLDGQRGLFMDAEISEHPAFLAMFGADGTPLGSVVQTPTDGSCYDVLPTDHGALFSQLEGTGFHLIEFDATGAVTLDTVVPLRALNGETTCPLLALTDSGFAYLAFESTDAYGDGWALHRVGHDGSTSLEPWQSLIGCSEMSLAVQGDTALATCNRGGETSIFKHVNGGDDYFPLERGGTQIPSAAGTLFLDAQHSSAMPSREILEIRCED